jgi:hypothetical protein
MARKYYLENCANKGSRLLGFMGILAVSFFATSSSAQAQSVGISNATITPSGSSMLEVRSTGKGVLIPRMSRAERLAINPPVAAPSATNEGGLLVFQHTAASGEPAGYYFWDGAVWVRLLDAGSADGWLLTGNTSTVPGTDFLGTTDNVDFRIKTFGADAFNITSTGKRLLAYQDGSAAAPLISWSTDDNMGLYRIGADVLGFSTSGAEAMRIGTDGNVGIGLTVAPLEKLDVQGNIRLGRVAARSIFVGDETNNAEDGKQLSILAGDAFNNGGVGAIRYGGDLVLQAGTGHLENNNLDNFDAAGGDLILRSGANHLTTALLSDDFDGGDIVFETGQAVGAYVEKMRIRENGVVNINSLAGVGSRVVEVDALGNLSATSTGSSGTVTSIATGTGLTGGPITTSGTISIANDGVTTTQILNGTVSNADLANMAAYTVKVRDNAAAGAPSDFAVGTESVLGRNGGGFVSIAAATNGHVLRRTGGSIGFSQMPITDLSGTNNSVYYVSNTGVVTALALGGAGTVLQSAGPTAAPVFTTTAALMQDLTISTGLALSSGTVYDGSTALTLSMANMAALSVKGNATNAAAAPTDIAAASDFQVLRRSGAAIGFGSINLASSAAVTGVLPVANGGTGSSSQNWVDLTTAQTAAGQKTWSDLGTFSTGVRVANGTAAAPTVTFAGSTTSGLYQQAASAVGIATSGVERLRITDLGIGILGGAPTATNAVVVNGKVKSTGINETSDGRLKKNITAIESALSKVLSLQGVTYDWRREEFPERNFLVGKQYGLIAQELERIIPELVDTDEEGWKSIEYSHLVPVLIEAIKEQQAIINAQQSELTSMRGLKDQVDALKASVELLNEHIRTSQK